MSSPKQLPPPFSFEAERLLDDTANQDEAVPEDDSRPFLRIIPEALLLQAQRHLEDAQRPSETFDAVIKAICERYGAEYANREFVLNVDAANFLCRNNSICPELQMQAQTIHHYDPEVMHDVCQDAGVIPRIRVEHSEEDVFNSPLSVGAMLANEQAQQVKREANISPLPELMYAAPNCPIEQTPDKSAAEREAFEQRMQELHQQYFGSCPYMHYNGIPFDTLHGFQVAVQLSERVKQQGRSSRRATSQLAVTGITPQRRDRERSVTIIDDNADRDSVIIIDVDAIDDDNILCPSTQQW